MAIRPWDSTKLILGKVAQQGIFSLLRFFFGIFQTLSWKIFGIQDVMKMKKDSKSKPVAQALKVLTWNKFCFLLPPSLKDFIYVHDEYIDPEYVIQNDNVLLFYLDHDQHVAVFGEGKPGQLLWHSDADSFIPNSLFKNSKRLIVMPMDEFHKVCARLPDPNKPLVIMGNTARCGSTLLTQVFECTNKVISYSEPLPLKELAVMYRTKGLCQEVNQLTRSLMRIYARPLKCIPDPEGYLIKPVAPALVCAEPIKKLYPNTTIFYLYRNLENVTKSIYKLSYIIPSTRICYILFRISENLVESMYAKNGFPTKGVKRTIDNDYCCGIFMAAVSANIYKKMRADGNNVHALLYDDLIKNKEGGVIAIFKASGLPESLVEEAMTAFTRDSQRNCIVSKEALAKIKPLDYTDEDKLKAKQLLVELDYSIDDQTGRLEGTLKF
ncbi:hypothetical protein CAPTEDRAFT_213494 [Capitella teleta]|uniref:Sulfotransferase domain-containing protein n=1 Tax=Capitella teleta TaxID=283909 RepID=R7VHB7_CAPTE|nr:hypothetical protein CAPTEDRAFT_213494 [Capitella teleta]|eukprot:ELU15095.1 hypothetical protein CAPTEDRAFT_213494 [Capitella teleta]